MQYIMFLTLCQYRKQDSDPAFYLFILDWRMALLSLVSIPVGMIFMMTGMKNYGTQYEGSVKVTQAMNATIVLSLAIAGPLLAAMDFVDSLAKADTIVGEVDSILNSEEQDHGDNMVKLNSMDIQVEHVSLYENAHPHINVNGHFMR